MSDYKSEDEREPFNVRTASPEEIDAHIGDLQVVIERLTAIIREIADKAVITLDQMEKLEPASDD